MRLNYYILIVIFQLVNLFSCCSISAEIQKKYSPAVFKKPECVIYDKHNQCLYVSNINGYPSKKDGNGFISKVSVDGEIITLKWIDNLDAPKGMFIKNNILYCTDISKVLLIDINSGEMLDKVEISNSKFLNDIIVTNDDLIIATDTKKNTVFIVSNKNIYKSRINLQNANGIYYDGNMIYLGANGNINIYYPDQDFIEVIHKGRSKSAVYCT